MIKNYLKTAWRSLTRNKVHSLINIIGLAAGITVVMLIAFWVYDETSYNTYFKNYNSIARIKQNQTFEGKVYTQDAIPFPLGKALQTDYSSDFKHVIMSSWQSNHILNYGLKSLTESGIFMDNGADDMLSLKMLYGKYGSLIQPNNILVSASAAKALFGNEDPMNRQLKIDNEMDVKVAGVFEDIPPNTEFMKLNFIASWNLYAAKTWVKNIQNDWGDNSFQTFIQLSDNVNINNVNKKIANIKYNKTDEEDKKNHSKIFLTPMRNWHLHNNWENGVASGGQIVYVWMFGIIGLFVLLLACINFMNLATARSEKRAKEVGIRKAVGSARKMLIAQFYLESILVVTIAFGFALLFAVIALPWFNKLANKQMNIPWTNAYFWFAGILFIFITGIISGSYPALYLSSFNPIKILKGNFHATRNAAIPRKALIVMQFAISLILIIGTAVVYKQIKFAQNRPVGYSRNALINIPMSTEDFGENYNAIKTELISKGIAESVATSSSPLTRSWFTTGGYTWQGKSPDLNQDFVKYYVSPDFGKTINWQIVQGRDFSSEFPSDSSGLIINESAVKYMGLKNPVGALISRNDSKQTTYQIVGVVKNIVTESAYEPVQQTFYFFDKSGKANFIFIKLKANKSVHTSIEQTGDIFKKYITTAPFEYSFVSDDFAQKFFNEERVGKLAGLFSALAVLISALGLFGMASFMAEQRTKEIGIRKVLGASVINVWGLLSKEFIVLVIIAILIAVPVAYYLMHNWLQNYNYRTNIPWQIFVLSGIGALAITLITISFQSIKAAMANPVKSLRTE
ncbi:FtsX-like permease family protein [Chitinophaga sancti]|uniref:FtsX-like permease family protein n=1 Tax=Chitinophaga sancti TaxID=1004 RepID=UPI002A75AC63|nr:FtsX-like permease family protein [Chitinophaga sancti]WPQ62342.1 FtsX-like permease family protein [Chitinophaga sancti]